MSRRGSAEKKKKEQGSGVAMSRTGGEREGERSTTCWGPLSLALFGTYLHRSLSESRERSSVMSQRCFNCDRAGSKGTGIAR